MQKRTLQFDCLINLATFSRMLSAGYLVNTSNFTITGKFSDEEMDNATRQYGAVVIETTDKVFSYDSLK